jgi:hypothetical protein
VVVSERRPFVPTPREIDGDERKTGADAAEDPADALTHDETEKLVVKDGIAERKRRIEPPRR